MDFSNPNNCQFIPMKVENSDDTVDTNTLGGEAIKTEVTDDYINTEFIHIKSEYETDDDINTEIVHIKSEYGTEENSEWFKQELDSNIHGEIMSELIKGEEQLHGEIIAFEEEEEGSGEFGDDTQSAVSSSQKRDFAIGLRFRYMERYSMYKEVGMFGDGLGKPSCYLCEFCGFQHKASCAFYKHYIRHLVPSELEQFECFHCGFKTRSKTILQYHIGGKHSNYKQHLCDKCDFRTKSMTILNRHQIVHSIFKHEKVHYKCGKCNYETNLKHQLQNHVKIHIDASQLEMFKCELCTYESKRKMNLLNHMLVHKTLSEAKSYDCELCEYKTKYAHLLRGHIKTRHKDFPESLLKKCQKCDFETNNKYSLDSHRKREHEKVVKPQFFKCDQCSYQTKLKGTLYKHLSIHKDKTQRTKFECYDCGAKFLTKGNMRAHIITKHLFER